MPMKLPQSLEKRPAENRYSTAFSHVNANMKARAPMEPANAWPMWIQS
jgi:hypothetical protein